ncbi:MAG: glutamate synthase subunit alpha, partial [Actinobacteria bacterium]|nr:glutamate synthase subunit alpha [Actinomycetota bacterium]
MQFSALPAAQGLYDPRHEADSCGVACLADLRGRPSHALIGTALTALHNMDHRGAAGAETTSGDGSGITVAVPDAFLRAVAGFELPEPGRYATGIAFLPPQPAARDRVKAVVAATAAEEGLTVLGWRPVPVRPDGLGDSARSVMPAFEQLFVTTAAGDAAGLALDRLAYGLRKVAERRVAENGDQLYFPSLSARTLT